ncbi:MAG: hypothetical protein JWR07_5709, partial [Nevskia sp.]|nr:hypothetical protein [Nevskia sp.]
MAAQRHQAQSGNAGFFLVLVASTFLMGSSFISGKILISAGFPPMLLVGWRFFVAALATLPLVLLDTRSPRAALMPAGMNLRSWALVIVIGLMQTAAVMGLLFLAMRSISASTAAILLFTNPIWVAVLGRLFLGESLHRARLAGLFLGIVGVTLAIGLGASAVSSPGALTGELIGLASALCWAGATIVNKRANLPMGAWSLSFWQMLIGSLALLAIAYGIGDRWPAQTSNAQWGWFLWLAIPASTGSFGLWFVALNKGGATKTSGYL